VENKTIQKGQGRLSITIFNDLWVGICDGNTKPTIDEELAI
jgi:hypothetical protein